MFVFLKTNSCSINQDQLPPNLILDKVIDFVIILIVHSSYIVLPTCMYFVLLSIFCLNKRSTSVFQEMKQKITPDCLLGHCLCHM